MISANTNTLDERSRFIAGARKLLKTGLRADIAEVSDSVIHAVPKDSRGHDGPTRAERGRRR